MCLITAIPKGKIKYSEDLEKFIKSGMSSNTDGSGFMYKRNGTNLVSINKGFRNPESILKAIKDLDLKEEDELVIHHRIGTSGEPNDVNMHPFVVSENHTVINSTRGDFNLPAMAHNGVFSEFTDRQSLFNDTYHFVNKMMATPEVLSLLKTNKDKFELFFKSILSYNRLAFLFPDRDMLLLGNFVEDNGNFHSNAGYKSYVYDKGGSSSSFPTCKYHNFNNYYDTQDFDDDDYYVAPKSIAKENIIPLIPDKIIKDSNVYRIPGRLMRVTSNNYKHFIAICKTPSVHPLLIKNKAYTFEDFDENAMLNWLVELANTKVLTALPWSDHASKFELIVKTTYKSEYTGIYNLINQIGENPSKSMLKKISKTLDTKEGKNEFIYKDYGKMKYQNLNYLYHVLKPQKDDLSPIRKLLSDGFTTNEEFVEDIKS